MKGHNWGICRKCGKTHVLQPFSEETRRKMSMSRKGKSLPERTRRKMSEARKGDKNPNYGKEMPEKLRKKISLTNKGKELPEEHKGKIRNSLKIISNTLEGRKRLTDSVKIGWEKGAYDNAFTSPTSIELKTFSFLDKLGIKYNKFYRINIGYKNKIVDVFIPPNIIIEADGDFWHSENCFGKNKKKEDSKSDKGLRKLGYVVYRIPEKLFSTDKYLEILNKIIKTSRG